MPDPFNLQRFVDAQAPIFAQVKRELAAGRKTGHWIWFVFPQFAGLGHSAMSIRYAIGSIEEARAYLDHDLLGPRLRHCVDLVNRIEDRSALQVFGSPDDIKFRSCVTLFSRATPRSELFVAALDRYFDGQPDAATIARLN